MIDNLKKILQQEDTVLFIGSGVSLWSGLPSWSGLIQELIVFTKDNGLDTTLTEQELKRGDLLQAASYGFDKLSKPQLAQFIRKASRLGIAQPHLIHEKIISLGPTCYITTNYDKLLELSFLKWKPDTFFRTVVNKQLTETAEIVGARANNFLFKLHGDAENSDSIILTREQYRTLNSGGELYYALETAKTLMLSRPIVYIGFGLRDPDFLYLKDLIYNTYKGGARDHYAIMADVCELEKDYWRRNFGIHIIDYTTITRPDGTKDHSPLLILLDDLSSNKINKKSSTLLFSPEFILSLNRYAAKNSSFEISRLHLPLVVHPIENKKTGKHEFRYYGAAIEKMLDDGPEQFILIGLPGGGKSYSLKASVARKSNNLSKDCIEDNLKQNETVIPIYLDLKLYQGNLVHLIEQNIPIGVSFSLLCTNYKVKLYLDAFNEMPKEYIESKKWNADFNGLLQQYSFSFVISSRTIDGLEELAFPIFNLDSIDKEFIKTSLAQNRIELKGMFRNEVISLLQKPFYYKLIFENKFEIESDASPQKIYYRLIKLINSRLNERFQVTINILEPLSRTAMDALDKGEEAFKTETLLSAIKQELIQIGETSVSSVDIINWLISQKFLIPLINERICFFHQSVTEYLAATQLATIYTNNNEILIEKLCFRSWDQALFLTLSLLGKESADLFLETVISVDFELALSAVKYLEEDTTAIVERLLIEIDTNDVFLDSDKYHSVDSLLESSVPISEFHIPILKKIIFKGDSIGGAAASCLIELLGFDFKNEAFNLLADNCQDYNFCTSIGRYLKKYILPDDLSVLYSLSKRVQEKFSSGEIVDYEGFTSALSDLLEDFNPILTSASFFDSQKSIVEQEVQLDILCNFLRDCRNSDGLKICADLLLAGIDKAAVEIHFILYFSKEDDNIDYSIFLPCHIKSLITIIRQKRNENSKWALSSLFNICSKREDLITHVEKELSKSKGVLKAALLYSIYNSKSPQLIFKALEDLLIMDSKSLSKEHFQLLSHMDKLDWIGQEILFSNLLRLRNVKLAYNLCDRLAYSRDFENRPVFNIGPIEWWLEWFSEVRKSRKIDWMFFDRVSSVITNCISSDKKQEFISEFNNPNSKYRKLIHLTIFRKIDGLKLENLTAESITYLFEELKSVKLDYWTGNVFAVIATENFLMERILPEFLKSQGLQRENLEAIIDRVGRKHKRRYNIS